MVRVYVPLGRAVVCLCGTTLMCKAHPLIWCSCTTAAESQEHCFVHRGYVGD